MLASVPLRINKCTDHGYGPGTYHELSNDSIWASVHRAVEGDYRGRLVQTCERGGVRIERLVEMRHERPRNFIESAHPIFNDDLT